MSLSKEIPLYSSSEDELSEEAFSLKKRREFNKFTDLRDGRFNSHVLAKNHLTSLGYSFFYSDTADAKTGRLVR